MDHECLFCDNGEVRDDKHTHRGSGLDTGSGNLTPEEQFHSSVKQRKSVTLFVVFGALLIRMHYTVGSPQPSALVDIGAGEFCLMERGTLVPK